MPHVFVNGKSSKKTIAPIENYLSIYIYIYIYIYICVYIETCCLFALQMPHAQSFHGSQQVFSTSSTWCLTVGSNKSSMSVNRCAVSGMVWAKCRRQLSCLSPAKIVRWWNPGKPAWMSAPAVSKTPIPEKYDPVVTSTDNMLLLSSGCSSIKQMWKSKMSIYMYFNFPNDSTWIFKSIYREEHVSGLRYDPPST